MLGELFFSVALASGLSNTCHFSTGPNGSVEGSAQYQIGKAYQRSTLVVTGIVTGKLPDGNLKLKVTRTLKGKPHSSTTLAGPQCVGTACTGFSIAHHMEMLFLLVKGKDGVFKKVDGDGNDICPNVFVVKDSTVKLGANTIAVGQVDAHLSSGAVTIPFP